ncbi:hypothetical protein [Streptomyces sp. AHA2]|uniref:hypothetical protein n=1 Tax=Streptomyces sp. AHA2 TaxID=3064526 RepID=UPI003FA717C9
MEQVRFARPKVTEQTPEACVRAVLVRLAARSARRRRWGERPVDQLPDRADPGDMPSAVAERSRPEAAPARLSPKQRVCRDPGAAAGARTGATARPGGILITRRATTGPAQRG